MPIYEYSCPQCGSEFEKLVDSRTVVACPSCESAQVTRRLSVFRPAVGSRFASIPAGGSAGGGGCCGGGGCGCH